MNIIPTAAFLKRNLRNAKAWKRENFLMWLAWHTSRYNACTVKDGDRIVAVGVARAIWTELDARTPYMNDEEGSILFVEQVASRSREGFISLLGYVQKRWPNCTRIMFYSAKTKKNRIYDMKMFMKKAGV